jgi:tetratricopeptide (TPR) repeat protein
MPKEHDNKFHISEHDKTQKTIDLNDGELDISIPKPDLSILPFTHSDEKQAVMLAIEMVAMNELKETELILIETAESFPSSIASNVSLCWLYLSTGKYREVETWAYRLLDHHPDSILCLRMLAMAEQASNKHLMAISHYQQLLKNKTISPLWHLLLGYSQQKTGCNEDAIENYRTFLSFGKFEEYSPFAKRHLKELST